MSENTANAGHKDEEYAEVCIGQMIPTEKGIEMPPQYAYRIDFEGSNVMVIPLEGKWKQEESKNKNMREDIKVKPQSKNQKTGTKVRRKTEKEEDREQA